VTGQRVEIRNRRGKGIMEGEKDDNNKMRKLE
jgi:hypothetical protein